MNKFLSFLDKNILRFSIALAILFIPLYPKLPSIGISHVWVYIRLEDFLILLVAGIWFVQLLRKKVSLPKPEGYTLVIYWVAGLVSLIYCLLFLASHLANFFPLVAALEYLRRIEYMILFFAAYSSVKKKEDIYFFLTTLGIALTGITIYGFGQKFYTNLWTLFPDFFKQYPFCFPAYLTGNEEFAKGTPFCLDTLSRISSTFGGNYDLSAYLVFSIPLLIALFIGVKRIRIKVLIGILILLALELLNFTSSRTSFAAYLLGAISMLIIWKKKFWIIPVVFFSIGVLFLLSTATLQRFEKTVQQVQIVQIQPGANPDLQKIIAKTKETQENKQPQSPPPGTVDIGSSGEDELASGSGQVLTNADLQALQEQNVNISTVSGSFLLRKAYALDISFTTRFQAEWPRDWQAFLSSPVFGTGYSSLTLASDNDYLRALGETGIAGTLSFLLIFLVFGIYMKNVIGDVKDPIIKALLFGLVGGTIGLLINAVLIDVFESSKVAETFWIFMGLGLGGARLYQKQAINYKKELSKFFLSQPMIILYLLLLTLCIFGPSIGNFFVGDDFTWLHWAATATPSDIVKYFINSQGFFYRPLDKVVVYLLYMIFSFQPQGYHLFILFVHFLTATGIYLLARRLSGNKLVGVFTALLFILHPAHTENIYWLSALEENISAFFIIFMMLAFINFREKKSVLYYIYALLLGALALVSFEGSIVIPFILLALDIFILKPTKNGKTYISYLPFVLLVFLYFVVRQVTHAFTGGGGYSYHISHILPNIFGNFFGYTGLFLAGLPFLSLYNTLRVGLRTEWIYFTIVAVLVILYLAWMVTLYKKKIRIFFAQKDARLLIFSLVFAIVTLLPFLPLGNIAPRYFYLASFSYCLALVLILRMLLGSIIKKPRNAVISLIVISIFISVLYTVGDLNEAKQWGISGDITKNTLLFFRKNFISFSPKTQLYFVDTPVMRDNTWVFAGGLQDGLWFIYRDNTPQVNNVSTVGQAENAVNTLSNTDTHIFSFSDSGVVIEVK
jgi:hypothetical protein